MLLVYLRPLGIGLALVLLGLPATLSGQERNVTTSATAAQTAAAPSENQAYSDRPALQHRYPRYKVNPEDVLSISFPLSVELNQTVTIQPDGYINLEGAGSIYIQGMTVPEIADAVKKAYSATLHDPIVDIDLTDFQKPFFVVTGQVGKPGQYDLRSDITVSEAIAIAGGFTPQAKTQVFLYHRISDGWVEVHKLSLKDILHGKNVNEDSQMRSGDMIFVPEKFITNFRKYVPYSIGVYTSPQSFLN
jgi:polysaccharide biosynthesis/export protein